MDKAIVEELERLTGNAGTQRERLRRSGLRKAAFRKALTIAAGLLALLSAGAMTVVFTEVLGDKGFEIFAAVVGYCRSSLLMRVPTRCSRRLLRRPRPTPVGTLHVYITWIMN